MPEHTIPNPTPESIARAKAHQQAERQRVFEQTGHRIVDEDTPAVVMHCPRPGCTYAATARSEGRATRSLAAHLVAAHMQEAS